MRVLVTGSRTWDDYSRIAKALNTLADGSRELTVIHGDCPAGADRLARQWCYQYSEYWLDNGCVILEERYPAKWVNDAGVYDRGAGLKRNAEMVDTEPDLCCAFIHNNSRGASHCASLADKANIPVLRFLA